MYQAQLTEEQIKECEIEEKEYEESWKWQMEEVEAAKKRIAAGETTYYTDKELREEFSGDCIFCGSIMFMIDYLTKEAYCPICGELEIDHLKVAASIYG